MRKVKSKDKAELVKAYREHNPMAIVREIAEALNIPRSSVSRLINR